MTSKVQPKLQIIEPLNLVKSLSSFGGENKMAEQSVEHFYSYYDEILSKNMAR